MQEVGQRREQLPRELGEIFNKSPSIPFMLCEYFFKGEVDIPESSFSKREVMGSDIPSRAKLFASAASLNK